MTCPSLHVPRSTEHAALVYDVPLALHVLPHVGLSLVSMIVPMAIQSYRPHAGSGGLLAVEGWGKGSADDQHFAQQGSVLGAC